jgi:hypothetical protein
MKFVRVVIYNKARTRELKDKDKRALWASQKINYIRTFSHPHLRYIGLSNNNLKKTSLFVNPLSFPRLEMIDLSNNELSRLVINVPTLKHLLASENFISKIKLYTPVLEKFILFNNRLKKVPDVPESIVVINLCLNLIKEFPRKEYPYLVSLYLECNKFESKPSVRAPLERFKW